MFAVNNAWSLMGQQFEKYGYEYDYEYEGNQFFNNDWMYYMDEIETNDGSYTPSEVDMEAMFDRTPPMLSVEGMTKTSNFTAGQSLGSVRFQTMSALNMFGTPVGSKRFAPIILIRKRH